jgi:DNA-binding transcriptional MerR regulator
MLEKAPDAFRTISEVADDLDVPQHVLRFWESRFAHIKPMKRGGGRRYYRPEDIDLLRGIRFLLYGEGYTIRGVQRILKEQGVRFVQSVWQEGAKLDLRRSARTTEAEHAEEEAPGRGVVSVFQKHDAEQEDGDEDHNVDEDNDDEDDDDDEDDSEEDENDENDEDDDENDDDDEEDEMGDDASAAAQRGPTLRPAPLRLASDPLPEVLPRIARRPPAPSSLTREDLHRLQTILKDLSDCRRMLDAALKQDEM